MSISLKLQAQIKVAQINWRSLRFETLVKRDISEQQWLGIINRKNPLFVVPANFNIYTQAALNELSHEAAKRNTIDEFRNYPDTCAFEVTAPPILHAISRDFQNMSLTICGKSQTLIEIYAGRFVKSRERRLHVDTVGQRCVMVARLGALPLEYIDPNRLDEQTTRLVKSAVDISYNNFYDDFCSDGKEYAAAIKKVEKRKLITALPLGQIALMSSMSSGTDGTPHRSSRVLSPQPSVFVRASFDMPQFE